MYKLYVTGLLLFPLFASGQLSFTSKKCRDLYYSLSKIYQFGSLRPSSCNLPFKFYDDTSLHLRIQVDSNQSISYLGLDIVPRHIDKSNINDIYDFIESTVLWLYLANKPDSFIVIAGRDGIKLFYNDQAVDSASSYLLQPALKSISKSDSFTIKTDHFLYTAIWKDAHSNCFSIQFPANNQLIKRMDKKELDDEVENNLKRFHSPYKAEILVSKSIDTIIGVEQYFTLDKNTYFKSLSSAQYYKKNNHTNKSVFTFNSADYTGSFMNLLLNPSAISNNLIINITHKKYGKNYAQYAMSYNDFIDYFRRGNEFYAGIIDSGKNNLKALLIIYNRNLNFMNLLVVNTTEHDLFRKNIVLNGKLYTNLSTDNINSLYGEDQEEGKNFMK